MVVEGKHSLISSLSLFALSYRLRTDNILSGWGTSTAERRASRQAAPTRSISAGTI